MDYYVPPSDDRSRERRAALWFKISLVGWVGVVFVLVACAAPSKGEGLIIPFILGVLLVLIGIPASFAAFIRAVRLPRLPRWFRVLSALSFAAMVLACIAMEVRFVYG